MSAEKLVLRPRCNKCNSCLRITQATPAFLRCANPPFSHASDEVVQVWNQLLYDCPCEEWTDLEIGLSRLQAMSVSDNIRPKPAQQRIRYTVEITYELNGENLEKLARLFQRVITEAYDNGEITGSTDADLPAAPTLEVAVVSPTVQAAVNFLAAAAEADLVDLRAAVTRAAAEIAKDLPQAQLRFLVSQLDGHEAVATAKALLATTAAVQK